MPRRGRYGQWGKHIELFQLYEDEWVNNPVVQEELQEAAQGSGAPHGGTGAPEARADFPIFLQTVIRSRMRERFNTVAAKWRSYVGIEDAIDFRQHVVTQLNGIVGIEGVQENGDYPMLRSSEEAGPSFAVGKYGGIYGVTMELVINDEVDRILNRVPRELGRSMGEYIDRVVVAYIESNPTYSVDGAPFFSTARQNEVTGSAADPNETNLFAILDLIKLRRTPDGLPFTVDPNKILVRTPSMKGTFDRIIRSQLTGVQEPVGGSGNVSLGFNHFFTGNYNPAYNILPPDAVVDDAWLNEPNDWYVFGNAQDRPPFVVAFLQGRQTPFIGLEDPDVRDVQGNGTDPYDLWFDIIRYKIRHFFGVAAGEPLAAFRARPT